MDRHEPLSVFRKPKAIAIPLPLEAEKPANARISRILAAMAAAALAAFLIVDLGSPQTAKSSVEREPPVRAAWLEVARANGAYELSSPALSGVPHSYLTRRHVSGGGRQDILTFGAAADPATPYVRVALYRPGTEGAIPMDPVEAVANIASESRINADLSGPHGIVITKFGDLSVVEMKLHTKSRERNCLAVAGKFDEAQLGLVAWYCNSGPELVGHGNLACILDRLSLVSSGRDERLIELFARAERNRSFCDVRDPLLGAAPRGTPDWIDTKAGPVLRGKFTSR